MAGNTTFIGKWGMLLLCGIFFILSIIIPDPIQQGISIREFFFNVFGISNYNMQTSFDLPTAILWLSFIFALVIMVDAVIIYEKAFNSDYAFQAGCDTNMSCIGNTLKTVGEWCWIRTEGMKSIPIEGNHVSCNMSYHTHRIGNHVVMEGHSIPKTPLTHIPTEFKADVRQRRSGIFGANICSVGYLSHKEMIEHKTFDNKEGEGYLKNEELGKNFITSTFINGVRNMNQDLNTVLEFINGESTSMTKYLENMAGVGKAVIKANSDGFWDKLGGRS